MFAPVVPLLPPPTPSRPALSAGTAVPSADVGTSGIGERGPVWGQGVSWWVCFPAWGLGSRHGAEHVSTTPVSSPGRGLGSLTEAWDTSIRFCVRCPAGPGSLAPCGRASGLGSEAAGHVDLGLWGPGWRGPQEEQVGGLLARPTCDAPGQPETVGEGLRTPGHCPGGI